jgi:hypothetical protein
MRSTPRALLFFWAAATRCCSAPSSASSDADVPGQSPRLRPTLALTAPLADGLAAMAGTQHFRRGCAGLPVEDIVKLFGDRRERSAAYPDSRAGLT